MEPSESYYRALTATQHLHAKSKKFNGRFLVRYLPGIERLIADLGCKTLLDYGCGKGVQWQNPMESGGFLADRLGVEVTLYDPGWPKFAAEPQGTFDIVICTQVLGSIPKQDLPWVVDRLLGFAGKALFVGERAMNNPLRKDLHAHMADEMPHGWGHEEWLELLRRPDPGNRTVMIETLNVEEGMAAFSWWGPNQYQHGFREMFEKAEQ